MRKRAKGNRVGDDTVRLSLHQFDPTEYSHNPGFVEMMKNRAMPFSVQDPLIFHVLTTLRTDDERMLFSLMRRGAQLVPRDRVQEPWSVNKGLIFARDEAAGDGAFIFTTPCHTYSSSVGVATDAPAVAFRLSTVLKHAEELGFRANDLEPHYGMAVEALTDDSMDFDLDEDDTEEEREAAYQHARADAVSEELETIADFGTQRDADAAVELVHAYAASIAVLLGEDSIEELDPRLEAIWEAASPFFPIDTWREILEYAEESPIPPNIFDRIVLDWRRLFFGSDTRRLPDDLPHPTVHVAGYRRSGRWRMFESFQGERPELLVRGELPLCEAAFYRDHKQQWLPVPREVCREGLRVNPALFIPG
jgi:hypothetical protein